MTIEVTAAVSDLADTNRQIGSQELFVLYAIADQISNLGEEHYWVGDESTLARHTHLQRKSIAEVLKKLREQTGLLQREKPEPGQPWFFDLDRLKAYIDSKDYPA